MQTITFSTGKHPDEFLLIGSRKIEAGEVGTSVHIPTTHAERFESTRNDLIDCLGRVYIFVGLVHISDLHGLAHFESSFVASLLSHNQFEQRGFSGSIRSYHTHDAIGRQYEIEIIEKQFVTESLSDSVSLDNLVTETRPVGNKDFEFFLSFLLVFIQ